MPSPYEGDMGSLLSFLSLVVVASVSNRTLVAGPRFYELFDLEFAFEPSLKTGVMSLEQFLTLGIEVERGDYYFGGPEGLCSQEELPYSEPQKRSEYGQMLAKKFGFWE